MRVKSIKLLCRAAFFLFLALPTAAQESVATFEDGLLKTLCTYYGGQGQIRQRINFHYTLMDGIWYPSSDIVETYTPGSSVPSYAGVHYSYSEGSKLLQERTSIKADGTRHTLRYSYASSGALREVSAEKNGVRQYNVVFDDEGQTDLAKVRKLERWQLRKAFPDPMEERRRVVRSLEVCSVHEGMVADPLEGDCFLFDADGFYLSRVRYAGHNWELVCLRNTADAPLTASFADPEEDPASLFTGSCVHFPSEGQVWESLSVAGALEKRYHGFFKGCGFLFRESGYGGSLDFAANGLHGIELDGLYVCETAREGVVAHNNFNFGNFLWGAAAAAVKVPLFVTRLGAHINNFFLSPDTRGTFDSADDQLSIGCGHHYYRENKSDN